jgi:FMN phosphatase YigB (HAD superfamily)
VQNLILDIDGTLYSKDTDNGYLDSSNDAENVALSKHLGKAKEEVVAEIASLRKSHGYKTKSEAVIKGLGCSFDWWNSIREACYRPEDYLNHNLALVNNISSLVLSFEGHVVFATNSPRQIGKRVAKVLGLGPLVESNLIMILGPEDLYTFKPQKEYFSGIAALTQCDTSSFISIGDRIDADIRPAEEVGMKSRLVDGPDQVIRFLNQFL